VRFFFRGYGLAHTECGRLPRAGDSTGRPVGADARFRGHCQFESRIDTREIDSEIETRGRNHAAPAASTTRGSCDKPKWPAYAKRSIRGGNAVSITIGLEPRTAIK
jgi:hypothetical protein